MGNTLGVQKGDPYFIIKVTIRNDYSAENPLPDQNLYNTSNPDANVHLTAQIFNTQGQINATDVTPLSCSPTQRCLHFISQRRKRNPHHLHGYKPLRH
ncbi:MAG: hypothetical protein ABSD42_04720 [Candidatus Bathyarchaeia archaeon]